MAYAAARCALRKRLRTVLRWKENKCVTVMKDLGPCFSACKEIHHGKVVDNASPDEEAAQVCMNTSASSLLLNLLLTKSS